jgi:hypothetical protein
MRCTLRLSAFACTALLCAAPAYSATFQYQTVRVTDPVGATDPGIILGPGMDGPSESPANSSQGVGYGTALYDDFAHTLKLDARYSDLTGTVTQSHIHLATGIPYRGTTGVVVVPPSLPDFVLGGTSGTYSHTFDLTSASSYNPSFVTANGGTAGAEVALIKAFNEGRAYWNIHSSFVPGGEIRGFLSPVPEPASCTLLLVGLGSICLAARRRHT